MSIHIPTIYERIPIIQSFYSQFPNESSCFEISDENDILVYNKNNTKFKVKYLSRGGKHKVLEVCEHENEKCIGHKYIFRTTLKEKLEPNKKNIQDISLDCVSNRYSLMFSELVSSNICPNFSLVANNYMCENKINYSISIQEYADMGDLENSLKTEESKNLILQSLITILFMNHNLNISINDTKPANILIKSIQKAKIAYKFNDKYILLETDKLALITDFDDLTTNEQNDNVYNYYEHIFEYYVKWYINKIYKLYEIESQNIDNISKISEMDKKLIFPYLFKACYAKCQQSKSNLLRDICSLLIICCVNRIRSSKERNFYINLITDIITLKEKGKEFSMENIFDVIMEYFNDVCIYTDEYDTSYILYNLDIPININTNEQKYNTLNKCISIDLFNLRYPDKYYKPYAEEYKRRLKEKIMERKKYYFPLVDEMNVTDEDIVTFIITVASDKELLEDIHMFKKSNNNETSNFLTLYYYIKINTHLPKNFVINIINVLFYNEEITNNIVDYMGEYNIALYNLNKLLF